jgi:hypothetical protein
MHATPVCGDCNHNGLSAFAALRKVRLDHTIAMYAACSARGDVRMQLMLLVYAVDET